MDAKEIRGLKPRLSKFLNEFADCFARKDTRMHLTTYVNGQLSDLQRKSIEPMALAARVPPRTLQNFLSVLSWNHQAVRDRVAEVVCRDHFYPHAVGVIDETSDDKNGRKTPGLIRHLILTSVSYLFLAKVHQEQRGGKTGTDGVPGACRDLPAIDVLVA